MSVVGILGGTFDPPHLGHAVVALEARELLGIDLIDVVPAGSPWQKAGTTVSPAQVRLAMVEAMADDLPGLRANGVEVERAGPTYTIDTVEALGATGGVALVIGADAALGIDSWHRAEDLAESCELVVVGRDGVDRAALAAGLDGAWSWRWLDVPRIDISSTEVRARVGAGRPYEAFVTPGVRSLMRRHGLYGVGG